MIDDDRRITLPDAPADQAAILRDGGVAVWREPVTIQTYQPAAPSRYPMFLDRRVYQGSSGRVYPLPFIEQISTTSEAREWDAIHLENEWVRLMLLPELGGRIHVAYDKAAGYDFFYRNNVIKPALVGLTGPWISGGVEFNWPQHHRPATFLPVNVEIERLEDGSVVVWNSDHDPFKRMKGMHGIVLRPGSSLIEARVRLHNRTNERETFLWWANAAARSGENYQSFFPQDVHWVADHARRAISAFPRADRDYYGVDYPARVTDDSPDADRLDWFRNIPVPTSYMVLNTKDSFFGGYDHGAQAGFVHWADRAIAPGKKQWTWGNAPFGQAWDAHLTDGDGPYVELMAGVFTDNQPDFSWLMPGEVREFSQYWYPYAGIGPVHQATREAAINVTVADRVVSVGLVATRVFEDLQVFLKDERGATVAESRAMRIEPGAPQRFEFHLAPSARPGTTRVEARAGDRSLVTWQPPEAIIPAAPRVAEAPAAPADVATIEELVLAGTHLEQYRHPSRSAEPYFAEALRRDPGDSRSNIALAAISLGRGEYDRSRQFAQNALDRLTARNPNPQDGEASYRLGLALERLGRDGEADEAFAKSAWDERWSRGATLSRAFLAARRGDAVDALGLLAHLGAIEDGRAGCLAAVLLKRLDRPAEAAVSVRRVLDRDPLDVWARAIAGDSMELGGKECIDVALEFAAAGEVDSAFAWCELAASSATTPAGNAEPIALYLAAFIAERSGRPGRATEFRARARAANTELCFPWGLDAFDALEHAVAVDPEDGAAQALLGIWLYAAGRRPDALARFTQASDLGSRDPVVYRNAAIATVETGASAHRAVELYNEAIRLAPEDPRLRYELDTLWEHEGVSASERLDALEHAGLSIDARDDLLVRHASLLAERGRFLAARDLLLIRQLQPWEGGEGIAILAWELAVIGLARDLLAEGRLAEARDAAQSVLDTPPSLGEARLEGAPIADLATLFGDIAAAEGNAEDAEAWWRTAASEQSRVPRKLYWSGIAALRLGALDTLDRVVEALEALAQRENASTLPDFFATSVPSTLLFGDTEAAARRRADDIRSLANGLRTARAESVAV